MRYIKVKCVNKDCVTAGEEDTIPAGRVVAGGAFMECIANLECTACGHDASVERV